MPRLLLFIFTVFFSLYSIAQSPFEQIRRYTRSLPPSKYDSSRSVLKNAIGQKEDIHYLYPLYQGIGLDTRFQQRLGKARYYHDMSRFIAEAGDYKTAIAYSAWMYDSLKENGKVLAKRHALSYPNVQSADASAVVAGTAMNAQVLMITESASKPVHRAFTYGLLDQLYQYGYRYLAMDIFKPKSTIVDKSLNGFAVYDPVAAELIRKAIRLGYTLVPYADTIPEKHTPTQTDSIQAANLFQVLAKDPSAKMIVQGSFLSICEQPSGKYKPMAYAFKQLSGIDPVTVEQTDLTEGSNFAYGRAFYEYFTERYVITEPSVILSDKKPLNPLEQNGYDLIVMHPPATYKNGRPDWLSFKSERKEVAMPPTDRQSFFVQAYYWDEFREDTLGLSQVVPADQTYITGDNGYVSLYLRPAKYKIVIRDVRYKVVAIRDRTVQ
jgi:hypothetical protein